MSRTLNDPFQAKKTTWRKGPSGWQPTESAPYAGDYIETTTPGGGKTKSSILTQDNYRSARDLPDAPMMDSAGNPNSLQNLGSGGRGDTAGPDTQARKGAQIAEKLQRRSTIEAEKASQLQKSQDAFRRAKEADITGVQAPSKRMSSVDQAKYQTSLENRLKYATQTPAEKQAKSDAVAKEVNARNAEMRSKMAAAVQTKKMEQAGRGQQSSQRIKLPDGSYTVPVDPKYAGAGQPMSNGQTLGERPKPIPGLEKFVQGEGIVPDKEAQLARKQRTEAALAAARNPQPSPAAQPAQSSKPAPTYPDNVMYKPTPGNNAPEFDAAAARPIPQTPKPLTPMQQGDAQAKAMFGGLNDPFLPKVADAAKSAASTIGGAASNIVQAANNAARNLGSKVSETAQAAKDYWSRGLIQTPEPQPRQDVFKPTTPDEEQKRRQLLLASSQ